MLRRAHLCLSALGLALAGCGGAMPLGHPAHVLPTGKVTIGGGIAGTIRATDDSASLSAGGLARLSIAPEVSPWASVRTGLGASFEAGLTASSRAVRLDARRSFESDRLALSLGLGASAIYGAGGGRGDGTAAYGAGFDVPLLLGWRSSADLYSIWVGPRVGGEILSGQVGAGVGGPVSVSGRHLHFGGLAGLRAGLRHLYAVVEAQVDYHLATGSLGTEAVETSGLTVAPFGGLVVSF